MQMIGLAKNRSVLYILTSSVETYVDWLVHIRIIKFLIRRSMSCQLGITLKMSIGEL